MKEALKQTIQDLLDIRKELNLSVEDKDLMDFAVRIINSGQIKSNPRPQPNQQTRGKPTEKQIAFLKKNEYNGDINNLSFDEAKALISGLIDSQRESKKW